VGAISSQTVSGTEILIDANFHTMSVILRRSRRSATFCTVARHAPTTTLWQDGTQRCRPRQICPDLSAHDTKGRRMHHVTTDREVPCTVASSQLLLGRVDPESGTRRPLDMDDRHIRGQESP
jgi:hypothetical protein